MFPVLSILVLFSSWSFPDYLHPPGEYETKISQSGGVCDETSLVIGVGFSRTGTSSLASAFSMLGYKTTHWVDFVRDHFELMSYFYSGELKKPDVSRILKPVGKTAFFDCFSAALFDDFLSAYPKAKFILTVRNTNQWLASYTLYRANTWLYSGTRCPVLLTLCHFSRALRLAKIFGWVGLVSSHRSGLAFDNMIELMRVYKLSDSSFFGDYEPNPQWIRAAVRFQNHVKTMVPPEQLLILEVSENDKFSKLANFLQDNSTVSQTHVYPHKFKSLDVRDSSTAAEFMRYNQDHIFGASVILLFLLAVLMVFVPILLLDGLWLRIRTWLALVSSYWRFNRVYLSRKANGHFDQGHSSVDFTSLMDHPATQVLFSLRGKYAGGSTVKFIDDYSVVPTYLPIDSGSGASLAAVGLAAADLFEIRKGRSQQVVVRRSLAGAVTAGYLHLRVDDAPEAGYAGCDGFSATISAESTINPVRKAYVCKDGKHVFMHGGFPKLKEGILSFFGCKLSVDGISEGALKWGARDLEKSMHAKGLAVSLCQTPQEWRASPQGKAMQDLLPIVIELPDACPTGRKKLCMFPARPLSGILVVEFSHVIASPVIGRTLAEHGALVVKVVTSKRPRRPCFDEETNHGKHIFNIDLDDSDGKAVLWDLLRSADILIDGYTDGVLAKLGFGRAKVQSINPALIYVRVSCYGHVGPLAGQKGFQQNANFATGVATVDDESLLGYQLLSQIDYATGFLGAYGAMLSLCERESTGRAAIVYVSLCQTSAWMAGFGARMPSFINFMFRATRLIYGVGDFVQRDGNILYMRPGVEMSLTMPHRNLGFQRWWHENDEVTVIKRNATTVGTPSECRFIHVVDADNAKIQIRGRTDIVGATSMKFPATISSNSAIFPYILHSESPVTAINEQTISQIHAHVELRLLEYGALLFRGLPLADSPEEFSTFIKGLSVLGLHANDYNGAGTHRTSLAEHVKTSSDEPPGQSMEPHMDKAHSDDYPDVLAFASYIPLPRGAGGETILADMRSVTDELRADGTVDLFQSNGGVMYKKTFPSREYSPASGPFTWQHCFGVEKREDMISFLFQEKQKSLITWEFNESDVLELKQICPATRTHPVTKNCLWFNGVHTNHESYYVGTFAPMTTAFGNGSMIQEEVIERIRACIWNHSTSIRLQKGDVLILDNMLIAHGRMSWPDRLPRKILYSPMSRRQE